MLLVQYRSLDFEDLSPESKSSFFSDFDVFLTFVESVCKINDISYFLWFGAHADLGAI